MFFVVRNSNSGEVFVWDLSHTNTHNVIIFPWAKTYINKMSYYFLIKIQVDPDLYSDNNQKLINTFLGNTKVTHQISSESIHNFLLLVKDIQILYSMLTKVKT